MDNGAHFYACDLQVHTPRIVCGWARDRRMRGAGYLCEELRKPVKQIQAVAVTDHHDCVMLPYLQQAAQSETDENGLPIPPDQKLVVFLASN